MNDENMHLRFPERSVDLGFDSVFRRVGRRQEQGNPHVVRVDRHHVPNGADPPCPDADDQEFVPFRGIPG